jgi:hypothetical protein
MCIQSINDMRYCIVDCFGYYICFEVVSTSYCSVCVLIVW